MRDKKLKHIEDLIEEYIQLTDEQIEIPLSVAKLVEKQENFSRDYNQTTIKSSDAQDGFKIFVQMKKLEERKKEMEEELAEVEEVFSAFIQTFERLSNLL
jgi:hypothetical protein